MMTTTVPNITWSCPLCGLVVAHGMTHSCPSCAVPFRPSFPVTPNSINTWCCGRCGATILANRVHHCPSSVVTYPPSGANGSVTVPAVPQPAGEYTWAEIDRRGREMAEATLALPPRLWSPEEDIMRTADALGFGCLSLLIYLGVYVGVIGLIVLVIVEVLRFAGVL